MFIKGLGQSPTNMKSLKTVSASLRPSEIWMSALLPHKMRGNALQHYLRLKYGANVSAKNLTNETALHKASIKDHQRIAEILLKNEAEVDAKDKCYETPLHKASSYGHQDMAEILLKNGGDANSVTTYNGNETPLHKASFYGHKGTTEILLKYGNVLLTPL